MYLVGLTGGIGSGKTTFAALLAERGAQIIDADQLGRDALGVGKPAWQDVVDTFGDEVLARPSMEIDRAHLGRIVFGDRNKLAALNAIVHPVIVRGIGDELDRLRKTDAIVVLDAALILEIGLDDAVNALLVVDAPVEVRRERLLRTRGMTRVDVDARVAAQAGRDALLERADIVVRNEGSVDDLAHEADRVWYELLARQAGTRG